MKNTPFQIFKLLSLFLLVGMTHPAMSQTGSQKPPAQVVDLRQVTTHPDIDLSPRVSPDGKWIAYVSRQTLNFDIWIRSTSGGRPRQITKHKADDYYPAWGPKSKSIIFVSQRSDAAGDIWRVRLRKVKNTLFPKGKPERLTKYIGMDGYPTVSPDGKKIAWVSDRSGREEIWFHNDNTGKISQLTFRGATHPCWSPNIELIAFTSFRAEAGNNGDIWIMNLHGRKPYTPEETKYWDSRELPMWQITKGKAIDGFPSWSPDAKKIVFLRYDKDTNGDGIITPADRASLWSVDVFEEPSYAPLTDDPILRRLGRSFNLSMIRYAMPITSGAEHVMQPWFGADNRIYFVSDRRGNLDIWSLPAQGYIPDLPDPQQQVRLAKETYPLPSRMTRQTLGPLFLDWNPKSMTKKDQQIVWDRALAFRRVIDFHGSNSDMTPLALYKMGVCYALLGYDDLARDFLSIILQSFADHPKQAAYAEMVLLGLKAKEESSQTLEFKLVDEGLQKIINSYGDEHEPAAAALIAKGDLLFKADKPAQAFTEYNKVLKNFPDQKSACAESQLKIGDVSKDFATHEEVVNAYLSVVKNYPKQREWMIPARNRILDLLTEGKTGTDDLIATYREITGRYSGFPLLAAAAQMRIARLLFASDDYGAALGEFDVIKSLYPDLTDEVFESQMAKSRVLFKMGQNLQAFTLLDNLVAQFESSRPDLAQKAREAHLSSLLTFADELKRQHDYQLAREQYRKAMRMVPRSIHAHRGYIECSYYLHKIDDVIAEYKKLDPFHSKNNILIYALGLAYSYKATEKAELENDPGAIDPRMLHNSSRVIAIALSYDYTLVEAYLTISYNYEMMENYLARQRALPKPFFKKALQTITAPVVSIYHTLTFYEETKPPRYYERAIHELTKAMSLNDEEKNPRLEANIALNLANNYYNLGEFGFEKAYEYYHVKLKYDSTFTDKQREALIYERMGHCALFTGDFDRGPGYLMRAISLYDEFGNESRVLLNTKRLALLYETANENDMAIEYYQKAADIEHRKKMPLFLMRSYRSIAYNYLILDEYKDAISYAQKALDILDSGKIKEIKNDANRAKIGFLGLYFPVPFFSLSSMGASSGGQLTTDEERAFTFTILGEGYEGEKEYSTAIDYFNKKLALFKKRKDHNAVATFLNNIAVLYFLKADYQSSWDYFLQSLEICEDKKIRQGIFSNSLNLSKVFVTMTSLAGEDQGSTKSEQEFERLQNITAEKLNRALSLTEKDESLYAKSRSRLFLQLAEILLLQFHNTKVNSLATDIGKTLQSIKNASLVQVYIEEALRISKKYKLYLEQCQAHFALGALAANYNDAEKGYENLMASRRLALQNGFNDILWQADTQLGDLVVKTDNKVKRRLGVQKTPFEFYSEAINILEAYSGQSNHIDLQYMRAIHQIPYRRAMSYLAGKGDYTGALLLSEQMRAKHFLDILDNENIELRKERHKIYFGNARFLQQSINELEISLLRARNGSDLSPEKMKEQKQQLKSYRQEYEELLTKIRNEVPDLESLVRVNPVSYSRVQKLLRNNEGLLTFVFLQNNTLAWFITPTKIHFSEIKVSGNDFLSALKKITGNLEKNNKVSPDSGSVFQQLFSDLKNKPQLKRVVLIPDESALLYPWDAILKTTLPQKDSPAIVVSTSFTDYNYSFQNRRLFARQIFLGGASQ
ncbi:MAG: tetratricopeptide repeat protein, partial [Calditrichaeota bacterium]|nr:tetratricopeptide repeat protein [Calditrichota bacterium]